MRHLLTFTALLLVAACGSKETETSETNVTVNGADVAIAAAGAASGLVDTSNLPDFVRIYEGATPVLNMSSNENGKKGGVITYTVKASVADVVTFYRETFKAAAMKINTEMTSPGSIALGGESEDKARTMFVTISGGEGGEPTSVNIAHATKAE